MPSRRTDMDSDYFFEKRYEQAKRFLVGIDESKNWKFYASDMKERELWDDYQKAYEKAIGGTASKHAPWYVIPADQKWFAR